MSEGLEVAWFTLEQLAGFVRSHRIDNSIGEAVEKMLRVDLIIIVAIGLLPVRQDAAEALYRVVYTAYEKRLLAIAFNLYALGL